MDELETLWGQILGRDPARIRAMWHALPPEEQVYVLAHLERMATEPDWTEPQRVSAQIALQTLRDIPAGE